MTRLIVALAALLALTACSGPQPGPEQYPFAGTRIWLDQCQDC